MSMSKKWPLKPAIRRICGTSSVYDHNHVEKYGMECRKKHKIYKWVARIECKATLIADSICKWITDTAFIDNQSMPGLRLSSAYENLVSGYIRFVGYQYTIIHVSTNDLEHHSKHEIVQMMDRVVRYIKSRNPLTVIAISSILPRPTNGMEMHNHRVETNDNLQAFCQNQGYTYITTWKCVIKLPDTVNRGRPVTKKLANLFKCDLPQHVDRSLFAKDLLHLNVKGISAMKEYLEGALNTIIRDKQMHN